MALCEAPFFYTTLKMNSEKNFFANAGSSEDTVLALGAEISYKYILSMDEGLANLFTLRMPKVRLTDYSNPLDINPNTFARLLSSKGPHNLKEIL